MFIVFDLDGTLALNDHRQHFVQRPAGEKKDWDAFSAACHLDAPNTPIIATLLAFERRGHKIEIWSGRSAAVRGKTKDWLDVHLMGRIALKMRLEGDHTPDHELKARWLRDCINKPDLVFDDRASVVAMWRAHGIVCCQVAPGDF
jgi:hypothetical protein